MLRAVRDRLGSGFELSIDPGSRIPRPLRRLRHVSYLVFPTAMSRLEYDIDSWAPSGIRRKLGLAKLNEIDGVLDCSGFQFSDQWGSLAWRLHRRRKAMYERVKKLGKKLVLLPQTFGPFEKKKSRALFSKILACADLIFAREEISYQHLLDLGCQASRIKIAPDFTNILEAESPEQRSDWSSRVCIVPNRRMIDKTPSEVSKNYLPFMAACIRKLFQRGLNPFVLVHEAKDISLALSLQDRIGRELAIVDEDPVRTKGILGSSFAVVGSRYHALVGALSQGVPSLGTSWAHKYGTLFEEYGCPDCLIGPLSSEKEIDEKLSLITEEAHRSPLIQTLKDRAANLRIRTYQMWENVYNILH